VKSITTVAFVWYQAACAQLLVTVFNMPEIHQHLLSCNVL